MDSCIHCVENHVGRAAGLWEEALAGYPARIGLCLGELGLAEREARNRYHAVATLIRNARKHLEAERLNATPPFERILGIIEREVTRANPAERKMAASDSLASGGCKGCKEPRPHAVPQVIKVDTSAPGSADGAELIILTALRDFAPSYSLVSVILDQARAAVMAGMRVTVVGMANMVPRRPRIEGVTFEPLIPDVGWVEDEVDDRKVQLITDSLKAYLKHKKAIVLTHDLVFQSWYVSFAKAIHLLPTTGDLSGIKWCHQLHSSVGARPPEEIAQWRARIPAGHTMVAPNRSDLVNLVQYYQSDPSQWIVLPNIRDLRSFGRLGERAAQLMIEHRIHEVDIAQLYPVSTPRMDAKGIYKVVEVFGELVRRGKTVRLVLANAHANGTDAKHAIDHLRQLCIKEGLELGVNVLLTSELWPNTQVEGLPSEDVADIFRLTNVFCFPSISEACGLVMLEAALSGCLLVLNDSLPVLKDFIEPCDALWIPWGNLREATAGNGASIHAAEHIISFVSGTPATVKRRVLRNLCLEALAERMQEVWGL